LTVKGFQSGKFHKDR